MNQAQEMRELRPLGKRAKLMAHATKELEHGKNLLVIGPFGIGKTYFCRKLARAMQLVPVHFSVLEPPREMAVTILRQCLDAAVRTEPAKRKRSTYFSLRRSLPDLSMPELKHEIRQAAEKEKLLLIADDFLSVSDPKLDFIRLLADSRYRIAVSVEASCSSDLLMKLRVRCREHCWINLPRLTASESEEMIRNYSRDNKVLLDDPTIRWMGRAYRGYPLMIVEALRRRLERK